MVIFTVTETAKLAMHLLFLFRRSVATRIMPCYGCQLRLFPGSGAIHLSNTNIVVCHEKILPLTIVSALYLLGCGLIALAQEAAAPQLPPAPVENPVSIERPDFGVRIPRPNAPGRGAYDIDADSQESENGVYRLRGHVAIELHNASFKADSAEYDENTGIFQASGNVYYRNYDHNEIIYCDRLEYNAETERGTFHHVRGYAKTKVVARPGVLTTQQPFYFEGASADKFEDRYILHDGFITDCAIPNPWWTLHSSSFDIIPEDRAVTRSAVYRLRNVPAFYFPYFYKSLKKSPRKSGFLSPSIGNSNVRGYMIGGGYYWAISRTLDATYIVQDFTARGFAHHVEFRGKPTAKSDFNLIFYGVQDRGQVQSNGTVLKTPGYSLTGSGRTEFGDGWVARGNIDYLSSLSFRQQFTESFSEAVFTQTHSSASVEKNFGYQTFNVVATRTESYIDAIPGNSVVLRKLPEFDLAGRDHQLASGPLPVWFSFSSSYGLMHRVQPRPEGYPLTNFYVTSQFSSRLDLEPEVNTSFHWGQFSLLPSFTLHETAYSQSLVNDAVSSVNLSRLAPELNIDFVLPSVERIFNRKTFMGDKLKHVIEPRARYRYVTNVNNFAETLRFDTVDLLTNTNELEIGLTNRIYAKRGETVSEILSWELYQKRFFDPTFGGAVINGQRNVIASSVDLAGYNFLDGPRSYSPIVSMLRVSPRPGIGLLWQTDYDPRLARFVNSMLSADVRVKRYFVSAGSDQVRPNPVISPPANQFRATFGYGDPNRKGLNYALSSVYDYRLKRLAYGIAQATWNTDCCGLSVQVRRLSFGTRNENVVLLSFSIANVGSVGNLKKQERLF